MNVITFTQIRVAPETRNLSDESYENIASMMRAQGIKCQVVFS